MRCAGCPVDGPTCLGESHARLCILQAERADYRRLLTDGPAANPVSSVSSVARVEGVFSAAPPAPAAPIAPVRSRGSGLVHHDGRAELTADDRITWEADVCPMGSGSCGCLGAPPRLCSHPERPALVHKPDCARCQALRWWESLVDCIG